MVYTAYWAKHGRRKTDLHPVFHNPSTVLHPFEKAREYTRALNAAKLERLFSKPFVRALSGHADGVYSLAKRASDLTTLVTGAGDGELRVWELSEGKCVWKTAGAHRGIVSGVCLFPGREGKCVSVGTDQTCKIWDMARTYVEDISDPEPLETYHGKAAFNGVDNHYRSPIFAACGSKVDIYDMGRSEPIKTFEWGADTINSVRFNPIETDILASCSTDRALVLYDLRMQTPLAKLVMKLKLNSLAWNPMEAYVFTGASEDHNCYVFDMRKMDSATTILKDHVSAVLDIDYSPTGEEICTGSYDRTVRIFDPKQGRSREVYHTRRMQRIFCVKWAMDSKFILSGSDDGNVRLWKANAAEKLGPKDYRERSKLEYSEKLKRRYEHLPEVRKVLRDRNVPKSIKGTAKTKRIMLESQRAKEENLRKHSKPGTVPYNAERKKAVLRVEK